MTQDPSPQKWRVPDDCAHGDMCGFIGAPPNAWHPKDLKLLLEMHAKYGSTLGSRLTKGSKDGTRTLAFMLACEEGLPAVKIFKQNTWSFYLEGVSWSGG